MDQQIFNYYNVIIVYNSNPFVVFIIYLYIYINSKLDSSWSPFNQ
jgi:hypothetical protein